MSLQRKQADETYRAHMGAELLTEIIKKTDTEGQQENLAKKKTKTNKTYKLQEQQIRERYAERISKGILDAGDGLQNMIIETKWEKFKDIIHKAGSKLHGLAMAE